MKRLLKQLASESMIYGLSGIVSKFINIFLVPLYTRVLLPQDYGALNLINSTFYFVGILVIFALDNSAARWFYDTENRDQQKKPVASWFWFQLALSVFVCLIFVLFSGQFSKLIVAKDSPVYFILPAVTVITSILPTIIWNWLRLQRRPWLTVILSTASLLLTVILNVLFTLVLKQGIKGILLAALLSNLVYSIAAIFIMKDWLSIRHFSSRILREMLRYALPLVPTTVAFWVLNSSASFFIKYYRSMEEVGLYSIGLSLASVVTVVIGAFQMAWSPFAFSIMNKPEAKKVYAMVLTLYSVLAAFVALCVALFAKEVLILLTTPKYYPAYLVGGILAFNGIIYGYVYIGVLGSSIAKKTSPLAIAILTGSIVSVILYLVLTPLLGKEGAALSSLIGYALIPVYVFYRSQKLWHIPYKFMPSIIILGSAGALFILSIELPSYSIGYSILIKLILLFVFLVIAAITLYISYKKEISSYLAGRHLKIQMVK